ncbi:hypothetical protein BGZ63DRAFT_368480, partial [Mariannaea sp. PMI_226]
ISTMESHYFDAYPALAITLENVSLRGKSVLITGGGSGIGFEIVRSFISRNISNVILVGRTASKLENAASSLTTGSTKIIYKIADISSKNDVERMFSSLETSPDFLINNAAYLPDLEPFVDADLQGCAQLNVFQYVEWIDDQRQLNVNQYRIWIT